MKVSVIVTVRNREGQIGACLKSLLGQDLDRESFEIIVVDNGSTDCTSYVIHSYPVKYLYLKRPSISAAKNMAIRRSSSDFVAFIDSDAVADKSWLRNLVKGFDHPRVAGCGGKILLLDTDNRKNNIPWADHEDYIKGDRLFLPAILGGNAVFRRSLILETGYFDDKSLLELEGEDVDISWRIHLAGYRLRYIHSATVYHRSHYKMIDIYNKYYRQGQSNVVLAQKYYFATSLGETEKSLMRYILRVFSLFILRRNSGDNFLTRTVKGFVFIFAFLSGGLVSMIKDRRPHTFYDSFKQQIIDLTKRRNFGKIEFQGRDLKISTGVVWRGSGEKIRIANILSGERFLLNEIGSLIWSQIIDSKPKEAIVSNLEKPYHVKRPKIERDLSEFILELSKRGFLEYLV